MKRNWLIVILLLLLFIPKISFGAAQILDGISRRGDELLVNSPLQQYQYPGDRINEFGGNFLITHFGGIATVIPVNGNFDGNGGGTACSTTPADPPDWIRSSSNYTGCTGSAKEGSWGAYVYHIPHYLQNSVTLLADTSYTFSIWAFKITNAGTIKIGTTAGGNELCSLSVTNNYPYLNYTCSIASYG